MTASFASRARARRADMSTRRSRRPLKGVVGSPRADLEECAMRSVQRRVRAQHEKRREERILASDRRLRELLVERPAFGHAALQKLGALIGADDPDLGKPERAGATREADDRGGVQLVGSKVVAGYENFTPGPSSNWAKERA